MPDNQLSLQNKSDALATVRGALNGARRDVVTRDDEIAALKESLQNESEALAAAKQVIVQRDDEISRLDRELEEMRERSPNVSSDSETMRALLERVQSLEKRVQDAEASRQSTRLAISSQADIGDEAVQEAAAVGGRYQNAAEKKYRWNLVTTEALDASRKTMELEATMATKRQFMSLSKSLKRHEYQLAELRQRVFDETIPPWLTNPEDEDDIIEEGDLGIMYNEPLPYVPQNDIPEFRRPETLKRAAVDPLLSPRGKARRFSSSPLPDVPALPPSGYGLSALQSWRQREGSSRQTRGKAVDVDAFDPLDEHSQNQTRRQRPLGFLSRPAFQLLLVNDVYQLGQDPQPAVASQSSAEVTDNVGVSLIDQACDLFQFTWAVTEAEENDFLEGLRRKLSRKGSIAAFEESADRHTVGPVSAEPELPRPCLFAGITGVARMKGGPKSAHSTCEYCKSRHLGACFIVTHAPGVDTGLGDRDNDGVIPKGEREWCEMRQPRLVDIGGRMVRYIVRKRKAKAADPAHYPPVTVYGVVV